MIATSLVDFRAAIHEGGRLAGLDVGAKTIGLALCDAEWMIASPAETLVRGKFSADLERLRGFVTAQSVVGLVVGLPLSLDGGETSRTQATRAFARNLTALGRPIVLWDERWSTQAVTRTLIDADRSRKRRAELVDKLAAAYILQGAIDGLAMSSPGN